LERAYLRHAGGKNLSKVIKNLGHMALGAFMALALFGAVSVATSGDPGTSTDPVVTKSYVEKRLSEISAVLDKKIEQLSERVDSVEAAAENGSGSGPAAAGAPPAFVVVELADGDVVTFGENTQVILRGGAATAIAAENDLPDVTGGTGLGLGHKVPLNHLIIIPKKDGRGMKIVDKAWLMIAGQYTVTKAAQ